MATCRSVYSSHVPVCEWLIVVQRQVNNFLVMSYRKQATMKWQRRLFLLDQHAGLYFYSNTIAHWNNSPHVDKCHKSLPLTNHPDSWPISLCSSSFMLHVWQRSSKYQFHGLWLLVWPDRWSNSRPTYQPQIEHTLSLHYPGGWKTFKNLKLF